MTGRSNPIPADAGSFRDSENRVYVTDGRILRGLSSAAGDEILSLLDEPFFAALVAAGKVVSSRRVLAEYDDVAACIIREGWDVVLEHEAIPFISYPYEWSFSMLQRAALLHLDIVEQCLEHGWATKDASAYNVQWRGEEPVFIDIGSFERWRDGAPWAGYRQFCALFLYPLMLRAHLGIDHAAVLRSKLDGLRPSEAAKYFSGLNRVKKGVIAHVTFPASVEASISRRERDRAVAQKRSGPRQSKIMLLGLIQGLKSLVRSLSSPIKHTDWSQYAYQHSYSDDELEQKKDFVVRHMQGRRWPLAWDVGCNTGTFSRIAAQWADYVVAADGDHDSIEQLLLSGSSEDASRILPLVIDLANVSPNQGWGGMERKAFDNRRKPDIVLCLALIHHLRVSANIPNEMFLTWLRSLDSNIIIEFVNRGDEMFEKLLINKTVDYPDYTLDRFVVAADALFHIKDRLPIKGGKREMFFLAPR